MPFETMVLSIMPWVFKCQSVEFVSTFSFENYSSSNSPIERVWSGDNSSSIEKSRLDFINSEIFLDSALSHGPANNLDRLVGLVSDFDLVESVAAPIVSLINVCLIKVISRIVVMHEVVSLVDHLRILLNNKYLIIQYCLMNHIINKFYWQL